MMTEAEIENPERKLTWGELMELAVCYYGYYTFGNLDLDHPGQRGDFMTACLQSRFPMYVRECNASQLEIIKQVSPQVRERAYGNPPRKEALG